MSASSFKPVYVLFGEDEYLRDEQRRRIVAEVVGNADAQLCVRSHEGEAELADVLDDLRTLPLMAPCRLVILRDADEFVTRHRAALEAYVQRPAPSAALLLLVKSWPSNTKLYKLVAMVGQAVSCQPPSGSGLGAWLRQAAQRRGKRIDPEAAGLLQQLVGDDLSLLDMEVEKLSLYVGQRETITAADVGELTASTAEVGDFALSNTLTASDAKAALLALDKTLTRRGVEFMALGQIASHLRRAVRGQILAQDGQDPARALPPNIPPDPRKAFLDLLRRRPLRRLQADFRRVLAADLAMKSGADPKAALRDLVLALCR